MGLSEIEQKLQDALNEEITREDQVIYILSRIRKILELKKKIEGFSEKFKYLNFYCNLALHSEINDNNIIPEYFHIEANLKLDHFWNIFYSFLNETGFSSESISDKTGFEKILCNIYSDTPLKIKAPSYQIEIDKS